ncbi:phospholipase D-like domain-containing protein [Polaribacter vadi]|uniref:PLD phosphodiesterase domain-containing protein n=1 Tax=Polaribacter vadi TaxID=1774273 RepID=A0A1B8U276_9FLAO|nr:hypothetical protein [Polaribacter vadi]OBY65983.1 hypothetical protein LPB3_02135 [Polaribacter vadi]
MKIINPNEIGSKISTLISESQEKIVVVSPYLGLSTWKKILINLKKAKERNVEIKFYYREIKDKDFYVLKALGVSLFQIDGLHTKLYFNESRVIVSSMNLYESSDLYSTDIAIYFDETEDYNKIYNYFIKYIDCKSSTKEVIKKKNIENKVIEKKDKTILEELHDGLELKFPDSKIKKASDYLFSKNLVPVFHLFIKLDSITIKYPRKNFNKVLINELEENIIELYKINPVLRHDFDFENEENYFYWDVKINENNLSKTSDLILGLSHLKVPKSIN